MRKLLALFALASLALSPAVDAAPKFGKNGGVGSASSTYSSGEPTGGTYAINGTTGDATFNNVTANSSGSSVTPTGATTATTNAKRAARIYDVRDFGATCNGLNAVSDTAAFQATVNAVAAGSTITFPGGCYLATTVNVTKAVMFQSQGINAQLYVPSATGFTITAPNVTFRDMFIKGNDSSSSSNIGFYMTNNSALQTFDNIRCENMNGCIAIAGGYYHQASTIRARNCVQYCIRLMNGNSQVSTGTNGVEFVLRGFQYDTDGGTPIMPTVAAVWVQDFDGLVMSDFDIIHGGQLANLYINPQFTRSGDHLVSRGYLDINTVGDGLRVKPEGTAISDRVSFVGTWIATQVNGVHLTGTNKIEGYSFIGGLIYNQSRNGFLDDNTYASATTTVIRDMQFSANATSAASTYSDIDASSTGANRFYSVVANVFNNSMGNSTPLQNVTLGTNVQASVIGNDVQFSSASGTKISGLDLNGRFSPDSFATIAIGASSSATLGARSGLLQVNDLTTGDNCLFLLGGLSAALVSQSVGTTCVASAAPSTSQIGVAYSGGAYKIFNGFASSRTVQGLLTVTRTAN